MPEPSETGVLVLSPPALSLVDNKRGTVVEAYWPEGIEMHTERLVCPNPECNCPDDYYINIAIKVPQAEYERIRHLEGWEDIDEGNE